MNPYVYVTEATKNGESLLSLCCGVGYELQGSNSNDITAVDIAPQYLEALNNAYAGIKTVLSDASDYIKKAKSNSVDVVSMIDAIEHMTKSRGLQTLKDAIRVTRKQVLVFTPEGFVKNEPHDAWGISGADKHQLHLSGWEIDEMEKLGFKLVAKHPGITQHNELYNALMFIYSK